MQGLLVGRRDRERGAGERGKERSALKEFTISLEEKIQETFSNNNDI